MIGDFEVTSLSDGTIKLPIALLLQGNKEDIKALLNRSFLGEEVETSINAYLINTGPKLILVDTGRGAIGNVLNSLQSAGYQPDQIDEIYLTHMHSDHVGGLAAKTQRVFLNATVYAAKTEADHWLSDNNIEAAPDNARRFYLAARASITPYIEAGKFQTFEGNSTFMPGITAEPSPGQTLVLWGDIIHAAAVQFENPSVTISFDSDNKTAAKSREQLLAEAAKNDWLIGGAHLSFSGFGHVQKKQGQRLHLHPPKLLYLEIAVWPDLLKKYL
jgi:glyoxylase-like metal-dependent hydrolase (beta-lactamase superfamily II)